MITEKAYAKVNLSLDIVGRRDDGYHLVRMVMQSLDIADIMTFEKITVAKDSVSEEADKRIITELVDKRNTSQSDDALGTLPLGKDNLIYKVAEKLLKEYVWTEHPDIGVKITLEKNIPIAAGMAGGSSDAAATLRGINRLFELGLMDKELMEIGIAYGADIPYCVMGGTQLSEGIGEKLTRLPSLPDCTFLIAKPKVSVSTAEAYGGYDSLAEGFGRNFRLDRKTGKRYRGEFEIPDVDGQVDAIYAGNLQEVADRLANVLEYVTAKKHPEIGQLEELMLSEGAIGSRMSGSGPTVFGIFNDRKTAENAFHAIEKSGITEQLFLADCVG